jgi:hypothetical protein
LEIELKNIILRRVSIFEFLHSRGQTRKSSMRANVFRCSPNNDIAKILRHVRFVPQKRTSVIDSITSSTMESTPAGMEKPNALAAPGATSACRGGH